MLRLIYVSSAASIFSEQQLKELLIECRTNNSVRNITGMLLYKDGNFMQALEGEADAVTATHQRIASDQRHRGMITILTEAISERSFPDWSMGFENLDDADLQDLPGYSDFLNTSLVSPEFAENPDRCRSLLLSFKRNMR